MNNSGLALLLAAIMVAAPTMLVAADPPPSGSGVASWAGEGQPQTAPELGFAPLSVTQSGVVYSPAAPAFDPGARDQPKISDLPAWASSDFTPGMDRRQQQRGALGALGFGSIPEPAAWALILIGTAMICGALRGLMVANRRLVQLRSGDETGD